MLNGRRFKSFTSESAFCLGTRNALGELQTLRIWTIKTQRQCSKAVFTLSVPNLTMEPGKTHFMRLESRDLLDRSQPNSELLWQIWTKTDSVFHCAKPSTFVLCGTNGILLYDNYFYPSERYYAQLEKVRNWINEFTTNTIKGINLSPTWSLWYGITTFLLLT